MLAPTKITDSPPTTPDETDQLIQGVFDPPNSFVLVAISRNKLIICVLAVALALIGTGYGLSRQRTYTASATLQVGQVNPNSPGFYSYVQSAAALATAFSRAISAEPVLAAVQHKLKLAPTKAVARLSAEPIPNSPVFRVIATGPTESGAIQLANVTTNALIAYESKSNSANPEAASLLHEYREASLDLQRADANVARVDHLNQSRGARRAASASGLAATEAERSTAAVRLKAIGVAYTAAVSSQAPRSGLVSLLAGATSASNALRSKVETLGFIGLLAGIVAGCLVAVWRERRRINRPLTAAEVEMQRSKPV